MIDRAQQIKLINQALAAAAASIELSRKLLAELTGTPNPAAPAARTPLVSRPSGSSTSAMPVPGVVGTFDGESMVTVGGVKYLVPANYASKTLLVCGDKLKMIDGSVELGSSSTSGENSGKIFKQIERVKRQRVSGSLSQKDGSWFLTTPEGSYKVLEASVSHFGAKAGDKAIGILPKDNKSVPFAALEGLENQKAEQLRQPVPEEKDSEAKGEPKLMEVKPTKAAPLAVKEPAAAKDEAKTETPSKKATPKVTKLQEVVAKVSAKAPQTKAGKKEETPAPAVKSEKIEKKSDPIISDDDLR